VDRRGVMVSTERSSSAVAEPSSISGKDFIDMASHSALEAHNDFYSFPSHGSHPISIFHMRPAWPLPTGRPGPQAQRIPKEARPICGHEVLPVWPQLGEQSYQHFDSINLKVDKYWPCPLCRSRRGTTQSPLSLVGVMPGTLSRDDAPVAAVRCKEILTDYEINDIEIASRVHLHPVHRTAAPRPRPLLSPNS